MSTIHPRLQALLEEQGLDIESFHLRGRPPKHLPDLREKRAAIVTALHASGCSWAEMLEITGLSQGAIQRLTGAMWCEATRKKASALGTAVGKTWKGKKRPGQLEQQWANGTFDCLRGRVRSEEERARLKEAWKDPALKEQAGLSSKDNIWGNPEVCNALLAFHRSPEERARRSEAQTQRMQDTPWIYTKGHSGWVDTPKGSKPKVYARSSYEKAAIGILEQDPEVLAYEFELRFRLDNGKSILPDFIVHYRDGHTALIEVKSCWVFKALPPEAPVHERLNQAAALALAKGWTFEIWMEEVLKDALRATV